MMFLLLTCTSACDRLVACRANTIWLSLPFEGPLAITTDVSLVVSVDAADVISATVTRQPRDRIDTVEIDFGTAGYPLGRDVTIRAQARIGGAVLAEGTVNTVPSGRCQTLALSFDNFPDMSTPASPGQLELVAGRSGGAGHADGAGPDARLYTPFGIGALPSGDLLFVDLSSHVVRKLFMPSGSVVTLAGRNMVPDVPVNMPGSGARLNSPAGIAISGGVAYVSDSTNNVIRRLDLASGAISTFAGSGTAGVVDGALAAARFELPAGIAVDGAGNVYVADFSGHTIRRISGGMVTTLAGTADTSGSQDGTGTAATFNHPMGLAVDTAGTTLWVADRDNHLIRRINIGTRVVAVAAGTAGMAAVTDAIGTAARFKFPAGLALEGNTNLWITDFGGHTVRKMALSNLAVTTHAGAADQAGSVDGTAAAARFSSPIGLALSGTAVYVADSNNHVIRSVNTTTRAVSTPAGRAASAGSTDGLGGNARFSTPAGIVGDGDDTFYIVDRVNQSVRLLGLAQRSVTLFVGGFDTPNLAVADSSGNFYVSDHGRFDLVFPGPSLIHKVDVTLKQRTSVTFSSLRSPQGLALDGELYVADSGHHVIRTASLTNGASVVVAGQTDTPGSTDAPGTAARLRSPCGLASDGTDLFIADAGNHVIRRMNLGTRSVSTVVGVAGQPGDTDGTGDSARLCGPCAMVRSSSGRLFVSDECNHAVRKIDPTTRTITTVVGNSNRGIVQPGTLPAAISRAGGLALTKAGDLLITDVDENVVLIARGVDR